MDRTAPDSPLVSVVIPCYRQGRYLGAAVRSALAQTHPTIEVIVVDDGSDDDTGDVARAFGAPVQYIRQANAGPAAARNTGIAAATGRFFLFLDADDILCPTVVADLLRATGGRTYLVPVCGIRYFKSDDDLLTGAEFVPPAGARLERLLLRNNLNPPLAFLCSRELVERAGRLDPSPGINACEDWELWLRVLFVGAEFVAVPRVGAYYRQHPTSHSRNEIRMARSRAEVVRRTLCHLRRAPELAVRLGADAPALARELRDIVAQEHLAAAYLLRNAGRYREALREYARSLRYGRLNATALTGALKLFPHWLRAGRVPARA